MIQNFIREKRLRKLVLKHERGRGCVRTENKLPRMMKPQPMNTAKMMVTLLRNVTRAWGTCQRVCITTTYECRTPDVRAITVNDDA